MRYRGMLLFEAGYGNYMLRLVKLNGMALVSGLRSQQLKCEAYLLERLGLILWIDKFRWEK